MEINTLSIEYLFSDESRFLVEGERHKKTLPFLSIAFACKGRYEISLSGEEFLEVPEGGAFIAPSNVWQNIIHHLPANGEGMEICYLFLDIRINEDLRLDDLYSFNTVIQPLEAKPLLLLCKEIIRLSKSKKSSAELQKYRLALQFAEELLPFSSERPFQNALILPSVEYIRNYYEKKITVSQLAKLCGLSVSGFTAAFKKELGNSPIAYLNDYRLATATSLLISTEKTISDISEELGFYDLFYFSRCFKTKYHVSPSKYRLLYRKKN